jgi:hypothetical protein
MLNCPIISFDVVFFIGGYMDLSRLNKAMWNYYKIQDQLEIIADVKRQLSPTSTPITSATTNYDSSTSANSEKGTQSDRTSARQTPRF